ncbi:hypothetical protein JOB18_011790 [Solea senegalensis]|uniref:Uncharacterized protein n=1 Tax=Solea senegalensis TaxID=28829 RepID=A0AAV6R1V0_SOLSE|nr:hypothetical protein JOB18_011790 [Solea senegalensis]
MFRHLLLQRALKIPEFLASEASWSGPKADYFGEGGAGVWGGGVFSTRSRKHFIELSRQHLQETTTVSGIPEPPPHLLSVTIRPLRHRNTTPTPCYTTTTTTAYGYASKTVFNNAKPVR